MSKHAWRSTEVLFLLALTVAFALGTCVGSWEVIDFQDRPPDNML